MNREKTTFDIDGLNIISIPKSKLLKSLEKGVKKGLFQDAHEELKKYGDLNRCMLKFEAVAYSKRNKVIVKDLTKPVFSNIIENYKLETPGKDVISSSSLEPLTIRCVSKHYVRYNTISDEIFVLSSFIERDDILVEFLQLDKNDDDKIVWLKIVQLNHSDVFNNCSLVFNPPIYDYYEENEELPLMTKVYFRLYRPSTRTHSNNRIEFYYIKDDSNYLESYSTDFLKNCAAYTKNKVPRRFEFKQQQEQKKENVEVVKEEKTSLIEEDSPKCPDERLSSKDIFNKKSEIPVVNKSEIIKTEKMETEVSSGDKKFGIEEIGDKKSSNEIKKKIEEQPTTVKGFRILLERCEEKMNRLADRTSTALLKVSETRSLYSLIATQRYLLSVQNDDGNTPLHIAIINSNFDILEVFVDIATTIPDYDIINLKNFNQLTPLLLAAHQKETEVCEYLLECGSNIYLADSTGSNCFHIACKNSDINLLEVLIKFLVTKETEKKSSIEAILNKQNYDSLTPLHIAAKFNCPEAVELLVKSGYCRINERSVRDGMTALHISAKFGFLKIVEFLLKQVNTLIIDLKTNSGLTALHLAVINKNYFIVRKLIANQANIFQESENCMNLACYIKECKTDSSSSTSVNLKDFQSILEYSKKHRNSYHYANNDELMYYLFKNEIMIPKLMINKILLAETRKRLEKNTENEIERSILNDNNFDMVSLIEKRMQEKLIDKKITKVENFTEKPNDTLTAISSEMCSLTIDENSTPLEILKDCYEN